MGVVRSGLTLLAEVIVVTDWASVPDSHNAVSITAITNVVFVNHFGSLNLRLWHPSWRLWNSWLTHFFFDLSFDLRNDLRQHRLELFFNWFIYAHFMRRVGPNFGGLVNGAFLFHEGLDFFVVVFFKLHLLCLIIEVFSSFSDKNFAAFCTSSY